MFLKCRAPQEANQRPDGADCWPSPGHRSTRGGRGQARCAEETRGWEQGRRCLLAFCLCLCCLPLPFVCLVLCFVDNVCVCACVRACVRASVRVQVWCYVCLCCACVRAWLCVVLCACVRASVCVSVRPFISIRVCTANGCSVDGCTCTAADCIDCGDHLHYKNSQVGGTVSHFSFCLLFCLLLYILDSPSFFLF